MICLISEHARILKEVVFKNISLENMRRVSMSRTMIDHVNCTHGWDTLNSLDPCSDSEENFEIKYNLISKKTSLFAENVETENYCLVVNDDLTYSAHVCREKRATTSTREWYDAINNLTNPNIKICAIV